MSANNEVKTTKTEIDANIDAKAEIEANIDAKAAKAAEIAKKIAAAKSKAAAQKKAKADAALDLAKKALDAAMEELEKNTNTSLYERIMKVFKICKEIAGSGHPDPDAEYLSLTRDCVGPVYFKWFMLVRGYLQAEAESRIREYLNTKFENDQLTHGETDNALLIHALREAWRMHDLTLNIEEFTTQLEIQRSQPGFWCIVNLKVSEIPRVSRSPHSLRPGRSLCSQISVIETCITVLDARFPAYPEFIRGIRKIYARYTAAKKACTKRAHELECA